VTRNDTVIASSPGSHHVGSLAVSCRAMYRESYDHGWLWAATHLVRDGVAVRAPPQAGRTKTSVH
jgi:hypothetical protein